MEVFVVCKVCKWCCKGGRSQKEMTLSMTLSQVFEDIGYVSGCQAWI